MRVWFVFLLCLAGHAMAAPTDEEPIVEEPVPEEEMMAEEEMVAEEEIIPEESVVEQEPEVGANPVQIETGEEFDEAIEVVEDVVAENPCLNHHCKKGKVCEVDESNSPMCVCQDPTTCPEAAGEFEHVCGTDNKTYDSSCHFLHTSAPWREPRRDTSCTSTTLDPANSSSPARMPSSASSPCA